MVNVRLGDVVARIKDKVDPLELIYYVGGEHFEYGSVTVDNKAFIQGSTIGPAFHIRFKPGDVLLMSRNPHLRKAGMVDFEGLCSDVSYVCRTRDENVLMQRCLPFVFQTDDFWRFAEANKKGSTNFFLNWSDFEKYEFPLPPLAEQKKLAKVLWAMERTKRAYKELLTQTKALAKSRFVEMFGDPTAKTSQWKMSPLVELGELSRGVSKARPRNSPDLLGGPYPLVQTGEVSNAGLWIKSYNATYSEKGLAQSRMWRKGTLCITIAANIAQTGILTFDACFPDSVVGFIPNDRTNAIFIHFWFSFFQSILESQAPQVAQKNINLKILSELRVIEPPVALQNAFAAFVAEVDKSEFALKQSLEKLTVAQKALMNQAFRGTPGPLD